MVFSSIPFLFYYLPILLLVYYCVPSQYRQARNGVLLAASLLFYAWGEGIYIVLLIGSIVVNHYFAQRLQKAKLSTLLIGIAFNLMLLGWYKYAGFLANAIGISNWQAPPLPLGISFFTFQAISYLIDVYRKEANAADSLLTSALYISSFPQLIAGPIVRYKYVAQQIIERRETISQFALGIHFFVIGLAQKTLIANIVGETADAAFNSPADSLNMAGAWLGVTAYGLQIYFDFAGYSNMALGLGHMLGFKFPRNFDTPYSAQSVTLFWRRWHMTLSEWFRDYLYIPLGGNQSGPWRTIFNLWLVFILCGFWHGAALTFILWGAWHGLFLSIERLGLSKLLQKLWAPLRHGYLLIVVFLGWVLFRAESSAYALDYYAVLFNLGNNHSDVIHFLDSNRIIFVLIVAFILSTSIPQQLINLLKNTLSKAKEQHSNLTVRKLAAVSSNALSGLYFIGIMALLLLSIASLVGSSYNPFIYFRF